MVVVVIVAVLAAVIAGIIVWRVKRKRGRVDIKGLVLKSLSLFVDTLEPIKFLVYSSVNKMMLKDDIEEFESAVYYFCVDSQKRYLSKMGIIRSRSQQTQHTNIETLDNQ